MFQNAFQNVTKIFEIGKYELSVTYIESHKFN